MIGAGGNFFIDEVAEEMEDFLALCTGGVELCKVFYFVALVGDMAGVDCMAMWATYLEIEHCVGFSDSVGVGYVVQWEAGWVCFVVFYSEVGFFSYG